MSDPTQHAVDIIERELGSLLDSNGGRNDVEIERRLTRAAEKVLALAARPDREGYTLVPNSALRWLNGEGPDNDGFYYGDAPRDEEERRRKNYWWRSKFRELAGLDHEQASPERDDRPRNAAEDAAAERSRASYYGYDDGEN